jgi:hypothetical protein
VYNTTGSILNNVSLSMNRALSFLSSGFDNTNIIFSESYTNVDWSQVNYVSSVYIPSFIAHSLGFVRNLRNTSTIISNLVRFLVGEMESKGIWRFYGREDSFPPPDFDDTCCVLAVLQENGISVKSDVWNMLLKFRSKEGLYYTWIDEEMNRNELCRIDGVVNCNILYCGALYGRKFNEIIGFINESSLIGFKNFSSWFESEYAIFYIISRAYSDARVLELKPTINNIVESLVANQHTDGSWGGGLNTTLALATLVNAGYPEECIVKAVIHLMNIQEDSGRMPSEAFFRATKAIYYGSPYLTTSMFIESLAKLYTC